MSAPRKSAHEKAVPRHVSVPRVLDDFVMKMGLSHSRLLQEKIESLMQGHPEYMRDQEASDLVMRARELDAAQQAFAERHGVSIDQVLDEGRRREAEAAAQAEADQAHDKRVLLQIVEDIKKKPDCGTFNPDNYVKAHIAKGTYRFKRLTDNEACREVHKHLGET